MDEKNAYVQWLQEQLDAWKKQMDMLRAKSSEIGERNRAEYQKQIDSLQTYGETVKQQIKSVQNSNQQAWTDMRARADQAWDHLHESTKRMLDRFK
jgi:prefoldin subunit 5